MTTDPRSPSAVLAQLLRTPTPLTLAERVQTCEDWLLGEALTTERREQAIVAITERLSAIEGQIAQIQAALATLAAVSRPQR